MAQSGSFVTVGRVRDAHGIKGELFILLFSGEAVWLKKLKSLRLKSPSGQLLETALTSTRLHKNGFIALSPDIVDRTHAEKLRGYELEVPDSFFISAPGETLFLREIDGFVIEDIQGQEIGPIVGFSSNGAQDLLIVRSKRGDFPIPFVTAFVKEIRHADRKISMDIPYGLLGEEDVGDDGGDAP